MAEHYKIVDWNKHYENNRSRAVQDLRWVSVPNRHDGEGYSIIMSDPRAAEIFSAWILLIQVASKCQARGTLLRDDGTPMSVEGIARKTRGNLEWFEYAIPKLMQVGWIERVTDGAQAGDAKVPPDGTQLTSACRPPDEEGKGIGGDGKEGMGGEGAPPPPDLPPAVGEPPVSLETALANCGQFRATPEIAKAWWLDRDKVGWLYRGQPITRWQSDLSGFAARWAGNEAKKTGAGSRFSRPEESVAAAAREPGYDF